VLVEKAVYFKSGLSPCQLLSAVLSAGLQGLNSKNQILLGSGRDAIWILLQDLRRCGYKRVMLPSYLCPSVISPFEKTGTSYRLYKVDRDLRVDLDSIKALSKEEKSPLLVIHYFGFPQQMDELLEFCERNELILIGDCAQSFLGKYAGTPLELIGDYGILSYRKFLPVPKGGALTIRAESDADRLCSIRLQEANYAESLFSTVTLMMKFLHSKSGLRPLRLITTLVNHLQDFLETDGFPERMDLITRRVMSKIDLDEVFRSRRENYEFIEKQLELEEVTPLHPDLPREVCPYGFPLLAEGRDSLVEFLRRRGIETSVDWRLPDYVTKNFPVSREISRRILTLPVHQQLRRDQLLYILESIEAWART